MLKDKWQLPGCGRWKGGHVVREGRCAKPECHKLEEQHLVSKGPCDVLPPSLLGGAMIIYLLNTLSPRLRTAFQGQGLLSNRPIKE